MIIFEVIATSLIPKTQQFTVVSFSILVLIGYGLAFYLLSMTSQTLALGVVYAIWSGLGIVLVTGIAWFAYGQKLDFYALIGIGLILAGTVVINLFSTTSHH